MWVVANSYGCDGNAGTKLNYFSTKEFALEFAIEALGDIQTKFGFSRGTLCRPMKESEHFEKFVSDLKMYDSICGNGMHTDDSFGIEIFDVPVEPEK